MNYLRNNLTSLNNNNNNSNNNKTTFMRHIELSDVF